MTDALKSLLVLAFSYLRFSTPDQAKGDSLRRQKSLRDGWLARNPNVQLDTSLTLEDKGISGFTGDHRSNPDRHALAAFLQAVEKGRIPRGSYLIVESLDRLTREHILPALTLVLNLIQSGIRVVQLLPVEAVYDDKANPMMLMMMIMELSRGHSESATKSERVGEAWQEKKEEARASQTVQTARLPAWLEAVGRAREGKRVKGGKLRVIAGRDDAVRLIFQMAKEGNGVGVIARKLNEKKVPAIGRGKAATTYWARSSVAKILRNRAVLGEYQPYTGRGKKRKKDGEPIPDFYPRIISDDDWYAARAGAAERKGKPGRPSKEYMNVFSGLLHDAINGGSLQSTNKGSRSSGGRVLVPYKALLRTEGTRMVSFPFDTFERAILKRLREIKPESILPDQGDDGADRTRVLSGRREELDGEIVKLKARLQLRYSDAVADVLEQQATERKAVNEQLEQEKRKAASPLSEAWGAAGTLLDALDAAKGTEADEVRTRLRSVLRRMVESIWCLFTSRGHTRIAVVQLWFVGGAHRDYLIVHRLGHGGAIAPRPASWTVHSMPCEMTARGLDLRDRDHATRLESALQQLDIAALV